MSLRAVTLGGDGDGLCTSTLRELKLLSQLRHAHVVRLLEIVRDKTTGGGASATYTNPSGTITSTGPALVSKAKDTAKTDTCKMAATDKQKVTLWYRWAQVSRTEIYLFSATADTCMQQKDLPGRGDRVTMFRDL